MSPKLTIAEAKKHLTIFDLWVLLDLAGRPGKSCRCPWRQDQHPSFSIYAHGTRWKDFSTGDSGDVVDFLGHVSGLSPQAACHEFVKLAAGGATHRPVHVVKQRSKNALPVREVCIEMDDGTAVDQHHLALQRSLSIEAVKLAVEGGLLRFGIWRERRAADGPKGTWREFRCWFITDQTNRLTQARRMDGRPWWPHGPKAQNAPGSRAGWIINAMAAHATGLAILVEGAPDLLTACHVIIQHRVQNIVTPIAILGANVSPDSCALEHLTGKRITIVPHHDSPKNGHPPAGAAAAAHWAALLNQHQCNVDVKSVAPHKDLNEMIKYGQFFTL